MPCTRPLEAWLAQDGGVTFDAKLAFRDKHVSLPCGKCPDCRLRRRTEWAVRLGCEARSHLRNSFVTLTYDQEHLPGDLSLDVGHWQLFAKRARKRFGKFRYYHCGEYGEQSQRPHYHAIIFGLNWAHDRVPFETTSDGHVLYESPSLTKTWGMGAAVVAEFSEAAASYVAKYAQKYVDKERKEERVDPFTGEVWTVRPEYATMSRRPGIGRDYYDKYRDEVFQHDSVPQNGRDYQVPRYFDRLYKEHEPSKSQMVEARRRADRLRLLESDPYRGSSDFERARETVLTQKHRHAVRNQRGL